MENLKKNPLSLQLNVEDFAPASNDEKKSLVVMRESVNFWKDGMRRLRKNKIAMVSLVVILLIAFMAYVLPSFWPYSYEQQIKGSNNLAPFEYSAAEQKLIDLALTGIFTYLSVILLGILTQLQHICKDSNPIVRRHLTQYTQACLH